MNRFRLVVSSLRHYWRTNLAVLFGVIAGTTVIGGALVVGDSVRASLRQMTLDRLGKIDFVVSGPRFVREDLTQELETVAQDGATATAMKLSSFSPAIIMQAGLQAKTGDTVRRAGQVNVYGVDERAWSLVDSASLPRPVEGGVVLNASAAAAINAKVGDDITIWIEIPSLVPRDTLMGNKDNDSQEIPLKVSGIAPDTTGVGRLGLHPTQALPLNAFVDLSYLQDRLSVEKARPTRHDPDGRQARVNAMFVHDEAGTSPYPNPKTQVLNQLLTKAWSLTDLNLRLVENKSIGGIVFESDQMILEDKLVSTAEKTATELNLEVAPVMVYLANRLWNPAVYESGKRGGYSMYSTVAGVEMSDLGGKLFPGIEFLGEQPAPSNWGEFDVVINEFLATDLHAKIGDRIKFTFHTIGSRGELPELEHEFTVRAIIAMSGAAIDRSLTPEVKGITDVDSLSNWDQPFPMDLDAVTPRDDEYWDHYRAIPKLFLPLKTAQKLWPSRYGSLTSLRLAPMSRTTGDPAPTRSLRDQFETALLKNLSPAEIGLSFQPVKSIGLLAAKGSNDFSGLFIGFSLYLIVSALILIGLLFRLGIEQRVRDLGLLGAVGLTPRQVGRQMLSEVLVTILIGGLVGTVTAVGYAQAMIYGLTHWWVDAVGTRELIISVSPLTLLMGLAITVIAAALSVWWSLRQLKRLSLRDQLSGVVEPQVDVATQHRGAKSSRRRAIVCSIVALILMAMTAIGLVPAAAAFFGVGVLLLVVSMSFLSVWLQNEHGIGVTGHGPTALGRLGLRNASRQRQRTVMTAGMIATATFLIVAVAAFRRDPTSERPLKSSGNGGFTLVAESSSPILYDLNTADGRKKLNLLPLDGSASAELLASINVVPFRVRPGEDASCLNLYQTTVPRILAAPESLLDQNRFAFVSGSWKALAHHGENSVPEQSVVPVLGDMNTLAFSLHKQVGQTIAVPNEEHPLHQLVVKGMFQDSIFQGVLVMAESDFVRLFPEQRGFRYFLIDVPPEQAEAASEYLETKLAAYGFDAEPVAERLARFLSVQNTYLSTFQTLGGLGLLLGTFGLATIMLRNVLERQAELALLRAIGFRRRSVALLVIWENAFVLLWGLIAGTTSALLAAAPGLLSRGADLPWQSLISLLVIVFSTGMVAAMFAVAAAVRLPIVTTLRGE